MRTQQQPRRGADAINIKITNGGGDTDVSDATSEENKPFRPKLLNGLAGMSGKNVVLSQEDYVQLLERADRGAGVKAQNEPQEPAVEVSVEPAELQQLRDENARLKRELKIEQWYSVWDDKIFVSPLDEDGNPVPDEVLDEDGGLVLRKVDRYIIFQCLDGTVLVMPCALPSKPGEVLRFGQKGEFVISVEYCKGMRGPYFEVKIDVGIDDPVSQNMAVDRFTGAIENLKFGVQIVIPGTELSVMVWSVLKPNHAHLEYLKLTSRARRAATQAMRPASAPRQMESGSTVAPSVRTVPPPPPPNAHRSPTPAGGASAVPTQGLAPEAEDLSAAAESADPATGEHLAGDPNKAAPPPNGVA